MPTEVAGVLAVGLIIGLVGLATSLGMDKRWAPLAAVVIGVVLMLANQAAKVVPGVEPWMNALLWGITLGLSAVGLYSGVKNTVER